MKRLTFIGLFAACVAVAAAPARPDQPSRVQAAFRPSAALVGDPRHPEALAGAIQAAYAAGARRVVVRPGVYRLVPSGGSAITLDHWRDAALIGRGVTLILTDPDSAHHGIDLLGCARVTVAGLLLSQATVTAYQGRVTAVGRDPGGQPTCDWRPDAGYPLPPAAEQHGFLGGDVNVVDARTRLLKVGCGDYYGVSAEPSGDGSFRARMGGDIAVGDWLVGRYGDAPFKLYLQNSRDCTVRDVTMTRNGFAPLREEGGGGNRYLHITWALGPPPPGATEKPLVTNAADGMHMTGSYPGPDIEKCSFQGVFLDDCIAIHGEYQAVQSVAGATLTLKGGAGGIAPGQPVRLSDARGYIADAVVRAVSESGGATTVTLDKDYAVPEDARLSDPLTDGAGYKIIDCRLGDTRSRGILAKADDGLIRGNILENCGMSAVSLGPEYSWGEADYVRHVTVEDNLFRHDGGALYGGAAILVHGEGALGNRAIVIRGNRMTGDYQGDIAVQWASGVTLAGNVLAAPARWPAGAKPCSPITLADCSGVALRGNVVGNAARYAAPLVAVGPEVGAIDGDDAAGIQARRGPAERAGG